MKEFPFDSYDFFGYIASGILIVIGLELTIGVPEVLGKDFKTFDLVALSLGIYVAGQIIASPAKLILESIIVKKILKTPSINLMQRPESNPVNPVKLWLFSGYYKPLPLSVQRKIVKKAKEEGLQEPFGELLLLHIRYRDYITKDTELMARLNPFSNKSGFNRNLSFTSMLFGLCVIGWNVIEYDCELSNNETKYGILAISAGIMLFYRYIKFFRHYSYELFNSYAGR